ncbi:MAG TPA: lycopene cyclase domain-containing protein [Dehalococcoidia bacterium]|nr:lycopene cyclase domain-containing protein [Dehalococcoidia bacterium]
MEYSAEVAGVLLVLALLDQTVGLRLLRRPRFLLLLALLSLGTLIFDGYLVARPVLQYGWRFLTGIQLGWVPLEDFGYGIAFVIVAVSVWEGLERAGRGHG